VITASPASGPTAFDAARRRDIDGLRAVAILAVLGYHANPSWAPGGFVGVDIFFVISGYLISGIIFQGLQHGTFSFARFYARRIKRIFPALLVVLAFVTLFGWLALYTDEYQALGKHVAAGAGFLSNIILWKEAGYFDSAGEFKPLLHLWSLGIEEQFYLLWPPLLFFAWQKSKNLLVVLAAITIVSFALNASAVGAHEVATFYLPLTRLWELSLGGMLAVVQIPGGNLAAYRAERFGKSFAFFNSSRVRNINAVVGTALLVAAIFGLSKYLQFPGWWALLPTLGSLLLIAAGSHTWINRVLLGNPLMVFVGLISYPLYLWHWPLLSFQRILADGDIGTADLVVTLALAFVLAWLTYRVVERPIRRSRKRFEPAMPLVAAVALIGIIGYLSYLRDIAPRSASFGLERIIAASATRAFPGAHLKQLGDGPNPVMQQGENRHKVLFLGDSEVQQYYPRIDALLTADPGGTKSVIYSSHGGCPPIPHVKEVQLPWCEGLIERGIKLAQDADIDTIVVAADWAAYFLGVSSHLPYYFEGVTGVIGKTMTSEASKQALVAFEAMVSGFRKANKTVYIVLPSATGEVFRPRRMISRRLSNLSFHIRMPVILKAEVVLRLNPLVVRLRQIAANTGAFTIDPITTLCNDAICPVLTSDGEPIYQDATHLNPEFVRHDVHYLDNVVKLIAPAAGSL
jgi:peptidoglycan/LPS O-acetylase OafA/YrhL